MPTDAITPAPDDTVLDCQVCAGCGTWQSLRKFACAQCGSRALHLARTGGHGRVRALTLVHRPPHADVRGPVPYAIVLVQLDEGPTLMGRADVTVALDDRVQGRLGDDQTAHFSPELPPSNASFS